MEDEAPLDKLESAPLERVPAPSEDAGFAPIVERTGGANEAPDDAGFEGSEEALVGADALGAVSTVRKPASKKESKSVSPPRRESRSPSPSNKSSAPPLALPEDGENGVVPCELSFFDEVMSTPVCGMFS